MSWATDKIKTPSRHSMTTSIRPLHWAAPRQIKTMITNRHGGFSQPPFDSLNLGLHVGDDPVTVQKNREALKTALPNEPIWLNQVHGTQVIDADSKNDWSNIPSADASVTSTPGQVLVIMTADCLPVLLASRDGKVVGAAHAGWRGLAAGVIEQTVALMRAKQGNLTNAETQGEIIAYLGPAIGPHAFEVGSEVRDIFMAQNLASAACFEQLRENGKYLADIYGLACLRLNALGIEQIESGGECTLQNPDYFSYRRDQQTGRMGSFIWIEAP
jgi:YfiH family protein